MCNLPKSVLIVGGGHGLGLEIAHHLIAQGTYVYIADLSLEEGVSFPASSGEFIPIDLALDDCSRLYQLPIDGLFITAGIGRLAWFETFSDVEIEKNFKVNTIPTLKLIHAYYPKLCNSAAFPCAVITSITGLLASPLYSVYSASKAALTKSIEAINAELTAKGTPNRILDVAPGKIEGTGFHGTASTASVKDRAELSRLASQIVRYALQHSPRYIPHFNTTYARVINNYLKAPEQFAQESLCYKLSRQVPSPKPHIRIGYLTGSFDLFHIGHLNLLRNARRYCDELIVGVHQDGSHKGKTLFIPLQERMDIVRNIKYVSDVIVCSREDMDDWARVHFNLLFVGSDYKGSARFLRYEQRATQLGVKIIYLPYTQTTSSTQLRATIDNHNANISNK